MSQITLDTGISLLVQGTLVAGTLVPSAGCVTDTHVQAAADIDDSKQRHRFHKQYSTVTGTAVTAATVGIHITNAVGSIRSVKAAIVGAVADDASRHVTIDLKVSTGGAAFASVLSGVIDLTSSSTIRTAYAGTITSPTLAAGDIVEVVVAVSGGSGNQAQGLVIDLEVMEKAA